YPRTDSRYITKDVVSTLPARLQAMQAGPYIEYIRPLLSQKIQPGKRFVDDSKVTDHHAIIPTEQHVNLAALSVDEKKLYDLIARRFLAVLYPAHRYEQTTITTIVEGEPFISRGKVVKDLGWRALNIKTPGKEENQEENLPEQLLIEQRQGEHKKVEYCHLKRSKTKPPARYTEATLLTAMESPGKFIEDEELREIMKGSGLGTPATRADIIEKLFNSFYIERKGKELIPTAKGIQLIGLAPAALTSPELTAQWEQHLTDISRGKSSKGKIIAGIRDDAREMINGVVQASTEYKPTNITKKPCPVCGKHMLIVNGKRGKMLVCPDRNCGHRQPEKESKHIGLGNSKRTSQMNQKLINQYSDKEEIGTNIGELLQAALAKKKSKDEK
ncbi:MAG: DNA topoisomerase III, partial [Syntrophomonadaceae bacterium]|nr:DNA topoisomerase III [Syntrophomonadaceae bacterium]